MNIREMIAYYERGVYTAKEISFKIALSITPDNLDSTMQSLPEHCLREMATEKRDKIAFIFNYHGSSNDERRLMEQIDAVLPLIKDWFSRQ